MKDAHASASSKFDEHERDTAKRAYPKELTEGQSTETKATRKIPKMDLEAVLRNESGTRRAVSREEIERFAQAQSARSSGTVPAAEEIDAHSRPTIDATPPFFGFEQGPGRVDRATLEHLQGPLREPIREPIRETVPLVDRPSPIRESSTRPATTKRTSRWHMSLVVITLIALCATWTTIGFLLGRYLPH